MYCDLHTHSNFSDGTFTTAELIAEAKKAGLSAIALTDHNTVAGIPSFLDEAKKQGVTAIAGTELSTAYAGRELHLLGLFIPPEAYGSIEETTAKYHALKEESNRQLIQRLNAAGYHISYEDVKKRTKSGNVNRAHVAAELVEKGLVPSIKAAFEHLLRQNGEFYTPPKRLDVFEAIAFLQEAGALPVLAHPFLELNQQELRDFLPKAIKQGLIGMEIRHSAFDETQSALAETIAKEFSLLPSGGSDFHGGNKPHVTLGKVTGNQQIPIDFYKNLLKRKACR